MKKIFTILTLALTAICFISCNKEEANSSSDSQLIGSWKGIGSSVIINGIPANDVEYILTFTANQLVVKKTPDDSQTTSNTYTYTTGTNIAGKKYFTAEDSTGKFSLFYSISGTTLTNLGGDTQVTIMWPETFEKAVL